MTLITRQRKGSKLTIQEMDGNLEYLEQLAQQEGGGLNEFKLAQLPNPSYITQTIPRPDLVGEAYDNGYPQFVISGESTWSNGRPFVRLNNGEIASVDYCQSVLKNGIFIYEAYIAGVDFSAPGQEGISGYWIAFEQDPNNPTILNKVGELKMTEQFWNYWYDYTVKDGDDNQVKLVAMQRSNSTLYSSVVKLTYSNGTLTAEEQFFDFDGLTLSNLYLSLHPSIDPTIVILAPEYTLDDDYYGMALGRDLGWSYLRNIKDVSWTTVGFNVLTGQTRVLYPQQIFGDTVTNFEFEEDIKTPGQFLPVLFGSWVNHPNGIAYIGKNHLELDNGNNNNSVDFIWSPYWDNPELVLYINSRDLISGEFLYNRGTLDASNNTSWYWDNKNIYTWQWNTYNNSFFVNRFDTNTKESRTWVIPSYESEGENNSPLGPPPLLIISWANDNGLMITPMVLMNIRNFGQSRYYYFTSDDNYLTLQSNNYYPTNMFGNKSYSTSSNLNINVINIGVQIDEYKNLIF